MAEHLARFTAPAGVVFMGKAQEKTRVFRTEKRKNPTTGQPSPWIVRSTALVNQYYFYCVDQDFGPFFLKFCSYFPYTAKLCVNGHEYVKRQLAQRGIAFEALDNGIRSCADPRRLQALCDRLSAAKIDALLRKWLHRLPHPFTAPDRQAGYRYDCSILQAEFSVTQVHDRPRTGRLFFEAVIRENLDLGRPDQVQLLFGRRVTRRTPGRFLTRVLTDGVTPSLHLDDTRCRIKQYHKEGQALRTETTINDARDFALGKRLPNLAALRQVGFQANRRLLDVQRLSHDCALGETTLQQVERPQVVADQRVPALRFADPRVQALFSALVVFRLLPHGFAAAEFRAQLAPLLGLAPAAFPPGRLTYDLRRLRLHAAETGNAGSFFKNPTIPTLQFEQLQQSFPTIVGYSAGAGQTKVAAGWLIEQCGWKGYRKGDAGCHARQALVLVNYGNATGAEIVQLSTDIINSVQEEFGIHLEREVNLV